MKNPNSERLLEQSNSYQNSTVEKCSTNGCNIKLTREDLILHQENCEYQMVQCQNSGCCDKIMVKQFNSHQRFCKFQGLQKVQEENSYATRFENQCSLCSKMVQIHFHCLICDDFNLCIACFQKQSHEHSLLARGKDKCTEIQNQIESLVHAWRCGNRKCGFESCPDMKEMVIHVGNCKRIVSDKDCLICQELTYFFNYHSKICKEPNCTCLGLDPIERELYTQFQ